MSLLTRPDDTVAVAVPASIPVSLDTYSEWSDDMVASEGVVIHDAPFVSVGGGIGSFVMVDYLRAMGGMSTSSIRVLSNLENPWQTYEYLTRCSQLPRDRRIRSDAASRPDNLWGFPSYAIEESVRGKTLRPLLQVFGEPVLSDFYTPLLGDVLTGIEREARRISYWDMLVRGEVRTVRRRAGGGYFTVLDPGHNQPLVAYRSRDVHLAVGYPGLRYLPDLQHFRSTHNDYHHVVNGYENHEHVYQALRRRPGTVLVRGGGIVTSAVVNRLLEERERYGTSTRIVQLFRTYYSGSHGPHPWARRRGRHGYAHQGFNYPKSAWGGQLKKKIRNLEGVDRRRAYDEIGGTTTPVRRGWQRRLAQARRDGVYRSLVGSIENMRLVDETVIANMQVPEGSLDLPVEYVIDCTGLEGDINEHQVLSDVLCHMDVGRNPLGRLDVERTFEVRGASSGAGRLYATGAASFGGYFPGVDTFLGLQISAQEIADDLARRGLCRRSNPIRSVAAWCRWMSEKQI